MFMHLMLISCDFIFLFRYFVYPSYGCDLTNTIHDVIPWCMLFAYYIVSIYKTSKGINQKLRLWRSTIESESFRISRSKSDLIHTPQV